MSVWSLRYSLISFWLTGCLFSAAAGAADTLMQLQAGELRVLTVPDVARVAVGDGQIINAVTTDEKEVIVFARREGSSALQIWTEQGHRQRYMVEVTPEGSRQVQNELRAMLERIPNLHISNLGEKLVVEGDDLSDVDRQRIVQLSERYPQLLDFTGQVGWDRMVLLDVQVVELPRAYLQELGVRWESPATGGLTAALGWDGGSRRFLDRPGETVLPLSFPTRVAAGYFGINTLLSARMQALVQSGDAVIMAQPQLLARSGATAEFLAGGEVPYSTIDANGNANTVFKPYGVSLRITPQVERNDIVRSRIEVEVSNVDTTHAAATGPALKTRRASTEFNVRSGHTLVLAGFVSREDARNVDAVPGLARIPVLGRLFRLQREQRNDTELAIFVTPNVVAAEHPDLQMRVAHGRELLARHFPEPARLNVPIAPPSGGHWSGSAGSAQPGPAYSGQSGLVDSVQPGALDSVQPGPVHSAQPGPVDSARPGLVDSAQAAVALHDAHAGWDPWLDDGSQWLPEPGFSNP